MAKVFITGSSDGLGLMAARILIQQGHQVVLHGRNPECAETALDAAPGAAHAVFGDLSEVEETRRVADQVNALSRFDAVIHNAGVGYREPRRIDTPSGASHVFAINVLAPYILTALIERPDRLIYLIPAFETADSGGFSRRAEFDSMRCVDSNGGALDERGGDYASGVHGGGAPVA